MAERPNGDQIAVTIYADMDAPNAAALQNGLTGQARVVVEQISPAHWVLRPTGYRVDTPAVSLGSGQ